MFPLHWSQKQDTRCLFCKTRCGCDWTVWTGGKQGRKTHRSHRDLCETLKVSHEKSKGRGGAASKECWGCCGLWGLTLSCGEGKGVTSTSRKSIQLGNPSRLQPTFPAGDERGRNRGVWNEPKHQSIPEEQPRAGWQTGGGCAIPSITLTPDEPVQNHPTAPTAKATSTGCLWQEGVPRVTHPLTQQGQSKGHRPCCKVPTLPRKPSEVTNPSTLMAAACHCVKSALIPKWS